MVVTVESAVSQSEISDLLKDFEEYIEHNTANGEYLGNPVVPVVYDRMIKMYVVRYEDEV